MSTPNPVAQGASLSDLLTAVQNLVKAINAASQQYLAINGALNMPAISTATVVKSTAGRVCEVSILSAGTTVGTIYDGATLSATTKPLLPLPNIVGVYKVNWPVSFGILAIPGAGQTISVSYS